MLIKKRLLKERIKSLMVTTGHQSRIITSFLAYLHNSSKMVCGIIELEGMRGESGSTSRSDAIFKISGLVIARRRGSEWEGLGNSLAATL